MITADIKVNLEGLRRLLEMRKSSNKHCRKKEIKDILLNST